MSSFVQVLGPAADGRGMTLDDKKLKQMLCAETVKDLPVVVLAVVGPRGSGKTTLLSAVQQAIVGSGTPLARMDPRSPLACEADRPGSAGAAVWPELLPVKLPSGEPAALLLLDTWGPLDDGCTAQQRASVLLFSALISSTLVVQTSAGGPVCPLGDLALLAKLGAAVQDVRHCTALQDLVLLMRDWHGTAPPGRQADFKPLFGWAESEPAAKHALTMMMEAADWYSEGDAFLFLAPDQTAGVATPADPVSLLAAPRPAKRFDTEDVRAGELADYLGDLAAALATPSCDAASLLHALIEANQSMVARAAEPVYEEKMKQIRSQQQLGPVSESELRGAHNRAAHDALMAFTMSKKMDSESMDSEKLKSELQRWLEEQYESKREMIQNNSEKLKNEAVEQGRLCKESYETWMRDALNESPRMTMAELVKNHDKYRLKVLSVFDENQGSLRHSLTQQRMDLSDELEGLFRKIANELDQAKEEAEVADAGQSLISSAGKSAESLYRSIMEVVQPDKLSVIHRRVQECAILQFDSKTKNLSEEHKSATRKRLVTCTAETLQGLLNKAHRETVRVGHGDGHGNRWSGSDPHESGSVVSVRNEGTRQASHASSSGRDKEKAKKGMFSFLF